MTVEADTDLNPYKRLSLPRPAQRSAEVGPLAAVSPEGAEAQGRRAMEQ